MTRAKFYLHMSCTSTRLVFGNMIYEEVSEYFNRNMLDQELFATLPLSDEQMKEALSHLPPQSISEFSECDKATLDLAMDQADTRVAQILMQQPIFDTPMTFYGEFPSSHAKRQREGTERPSLFSAHTMPASCGFQSASRLGGQSCVVPRLQQSQSAPSFAHVSSATFGASGGTVTANAPVQHAARQFAPSAATGPCKARPVHSSLPHAQVLMGLPELYG
jgi:hypothetical protein